MEQAAGGGVVVTILTSEGSLVRTQLCPLRGLHVSVRPIFTFGSDIRGRPQWCDYGLLPRRVRCVRARLLFVGPGRSRAGCRCWCAVLVAEVRGMAGRRPG